jgi:hypothetical protein
LQVGILQVRNFAGWNFAGWEFCRLEFCRLPGTLQVDSVNLNYTTFLVFKYNLVVHLLQSDSLSALLISAYPATMFLASALRLVAITPVKTLKMTGLAWTYRGTNVLIVARCLYDVMAIILECCSKLTNSRVMIQ